LNCLGDLRRTGENYLFSSLLEELGVSPDSKLVKDVYSDLAAFESRCDTAQHKVSDKQKSLNQIIVQSQDALSNMSEMMEWVKKGEELMRETTPVSLDRTILTEQIQVGLEAVYLRLKGRSYRINDHTTVIVSRRLVLFLYCIVPLIDQSVKSLSCSSCSTFILSLFTRLSFPFLHCLPSQI